MFKGLGLIDTIILVLAIGFFFIGISQIILVGFAGSYWLFMLTFVLLIAYQHRKSVEKEKEKLEEETKQKTLKTAKNQHKK